MIFKKLSLLLFVCTIIGCSEDDQDNNQPVNNSDYFPLQVENNWTYNNFYQINGQPPIENLETLTVTSSMQTNGNTVYTFESNPAANFGTITGILNQGEAYKTNGKLVYNGNLTVDFNELGFNQLDLNPINLLIENAIVYDKNANAGENLFSITNEVTQNVDYQGNTIPVTFSYTISTDQAAYLENYQIDEQVYEDILTSNFSVDMEIYATILGIPFPILDNQEVISSTNYYASDVGLIYSENNYDFSFDAIEELSLPQTEIHGESSQSINSYDVE